MPYQNETIALLSQNSGKEDGEGKGRMAVDEDPEDEDRICWSSEIALRVIFVQMSGKYKNITCIFLSLNY